MPSTALPSAVNARFESLLPELQSRAAALGNCHHDPKSAVADALSLMFINYASAASRGVWLSPPALGWAAMKSLRCRWLPKMRVREHQVSLNNRIDDDRVAAEVLEALATNERENPAQQAARRIDWRAFTNTLCERHRRILHGLAIGDSKCQIARRIGVSPGRLTQILDLIADEAIAFFGPDILPLA